MRCFKMPRLFYQVLKKVMEGWLPNEEAAPQPDSDLLLVLTCFCQQAHCWSAWSWAGSQIWQSQVINSIEQ
jgi:hypothetical protein